MTMAMYLTEMTRTSEETISDNTPSTLSSVRVTGWGSEETLAHGVQRAGPDVAVHDTNGSKGQRAITPRG